MSQSDSKRFKKWYSVTKNRNSVLKRVKKYFKENRSKIMKYREKNKEKIKNYNKRYYKKTI